MKLKLGYYYIVFLKGENRERVVFKTKDKEEVLKKGAELHKKFTEKKKYGWLECFTPSIDLGIPTINSYNVWEVK